MQRARLLDEFGLSYADDLEIGDDDSRPNLGGPALLLRLIEDEQSDERQSGTRRAARTVAAQ